MVSVALYELSKAHPVQSYLSTLHHFLDSIAGKVCKKIVK